MLPHLNVDHAPCIKVVGFIRRNGGSGGLAGIGARGMDLRVPEQENGADAEFCNQHTRGKSPDRAAGAGGPRAINHFGSGVRQTDRSDLMAGSHPRPGALHMAAFQGRVDDHRRN
jgi:hypothetical protein